MCLQNCASADEAMQKLENHRALAMSEELGKGAILVQSRKGQ